MSIFSDKLTHVQVVINCPHSVTQFGTGKDTLVHISGMPSNDNFMSYDSLTTLLTTFRIFSTFETQVLECECCIQLDETYLVSSKSSVQWGSA